jgi:hypothetical protein
MPGEWGKCDRHEDQGMVWDYRECRRDGGGDSGSVLRPGARDINRSPIPATAAAAITPSAAS